METQHAASDVIVVGGGLAGLSAATYLARAGVPVTLFEKAAGLGGRAATQRYDEYHFNRGAHALYPGGAASRVLKELGIPYSGGSPRGLLGLRQGRLGLLPATPGTLLRTPLLDAADKWELLRVLVGLTMGHAAALRGVSVQDLLARRVRRPRVRQVLASIARTSVYSAALDLLSAEAFVTQLQLSAKRPVVYVDGGWQTLVDGLRRAATQAGARIVSGTRVEAVETRAGRAVGVRLRDGRQVPAAAVILATTPADVRHLVDAAAAPALHQALDSAVPVEVACLDVALSRLPAPEHPVVFDLDGPRFLTAQSLFTRIAPPGGAVVHTLKYQTPEQPSDPHADERDLEALLDTTQPGWRDVLVKRIFLPRIDAVSLLPTARGGGFAGRPGPQVGDVAGLYLAGDWIGAEGYLTDATLASARQAAQLLLHGDLAALRGAGQRLPVGSVV